MGEILKKCIILRIVAFIIVFGAFAFVVFVLLLSQEINVGWIFLSFIFQLIFCMFLIYIFIPDSVNKESINQNGTAFLINLIFLISTTMFITVNTFYFEWWFQTISFITLFLLLIFINIRINKEIKFNLFALKISSFFMNVFISGIMVLLKTHLNNDNIQDFMHYYYLTPLLLLQGLYQILGKK